jgi:general secretion pathway protein D
MNKLFFTFLILVSTVFASNETVFINTKNLKLSDFIQIVSKTTSKTIILPKENLKQKIKIAQVNEVKKENLFNILEVVLQQNNLELQKQGDFYKIVKLTKEIKKKKVEEKQKLITHVVQLNNAKASDVQKTLEPLFIDRKYKKEEVKPFVSSDDETNSIVIMGSRNIINDFTSIIRALDKQRPQVYVKARILELSELKSKDIGVKYGLEGGMTGSYGIISFATSLGGSAQPVNTSNIGLSIPNLSKAISLGASINLLNANGALDIVSEPSLLCLNNKASSIYIGQTKSIKTNSSVDSTGSVTSNSFTREDIGLKLSVTPRILQENKVVLDIETLLEDVRATTTNDQPDTSKKEIKTTAVVNSGESVVLGGLKKSSIDILKEEVPFLSSLPVVGNLFSNRSKIQDKINLVIIVTPYIVSTSQDLSFITSELVKLELLENDIVKSLEVKFQQSKSEND